MAISGPLSGPSGSPRSPAEPHPPSLAWVETPLPLGPLPLPPGPLNAKHSKRAPGAVFNGTHSPVRSEPSSPPPGSPQRDGGHPAIAPGAVLHVRSRRVTTSFCAVGAKLRAVPLAKSPRAEWVGSQKFDSCSLHSLGQLPKRADEANRLVRSLQPIGSQNAASVHRLQHRVDLKVRRKQHQFTERNTGLQNTTGSSWPHLRTNVRSIRQSAVSGRAPSSFTSVGGNTSREF